MKLKKGDNVIVMSGKEKGKRGKITKVYLQDLRIAVEGVNIKKRHRRPTKSGEKGQVIEKQNPIPAGKAQLVCPKCGKPTRVGHKQEGKSKVRVCKKCGAQI